MRHRAICAATFILLTGCRREFNVPECAHEISGCADTGKASTFDDGIDAPESAADTCECKPGEVASVSGTCPGALEKRVKTCSSACVWSDDTCLLPKGWTRIAESPANLAGRMAAPIVWTGGELIVFGGGEITDIFAGKNDGAVFSLVKNAWTALPDTAAAARQGHSGVWTGREMIVFGGRDAWTKTFGDCWAYDPLLKTWEKLPDGPLAGRSEHGAVYVPTLKKMIVWGGSGASGPLGDGAAYDVADRSWTLLPVAPISARTHVQMVWTGSEVLVFGGDTATGTASNGALLNLATGTWRDVPIAPVDARSAPNAALTTGGFVFFGPGTDGSGAPFDGARLALGTLTWSTIPVPEPAALAPRGGMQSWSDGERLFLWSGASSIDPPMFVEGGAAFDVTSSTWQPLEGKDAPAGRTRAVALWTGKAGLIWGGFGTPGGGAMMPLADGAIYVP